MITSKEIISEIKSALKMFGEYTYYDKGAREVMDVSKIVESLKEMEVKDILTVLAEVEKNKHSAPCLQEICYQFQDWDSPKTDALFESELFQKY